MVKWTHWKSFQLNVDIFRFQIPQATKNLSSLRKCVHQQLRHSYCSAVKNMALAKLLKLQELLNYNCYQLKKSNNCQPITLTVRECSQYLTERLLYPPHSQRQKNSWKTKERKQPNNIHKQVIEDLQVLGRAGDKYWWTRWQFESSWRSMREKCPYRALILQRDAENWSDSQWEFI